MIGRPPKQAFMVFVGPTIFTMVQAKNQVTAQQQFNLDNNWRSTPELIAAGKYPVHE